MVARKYAQDYEVITQNDERGREKTELAYRGDYYAVRFNKGNLSNYRKLTQLVTFLTLVLHIGAGFINNAGMRQFYIALPYVTAFLPLFFLAAGTIAQPMGHQSYRRNQIALSFNRIRKSSLALFFLFFLCALGNTGFILFAGPSNNPRLETLFIAFETCAAIAIGWLTIFQREINIQINSTK